MVLKRKQSAHSVCIEKKKVILPRKPPNKADLVEEIKLIKKLNDAMEEEIKDSDNKIAILEEREKKNLKAIQELQKMVEELKAPHHGESLNPPGPQQSSECQTYTENIQILCNVCIHVATCEEELNWHMGDEHDLPSDSYFDTDFSCEICGKWCRSASDLILHHRKHEASINSTKIQTLQEENSLASCKFCDNKFRTRQALMIHNKNEHSKNVSDCWNFSVGKCDFGEHCWFIHNKKKETHEIECSICTKKFGNLNTFHHHQKSDHAETVKKCRNNKCQYGDQGCWFLHDILEKNVENQEVTEGILKIMEKFTKRILNLENQISVKI